jgi:hypothetical protein
LSAPYGGFDGNDPSICYFAFSVTPIIISAVNGINYALTDDPPLPDQLAEAKEFADKCYAMQGFYGIINISVAIMNAFITQISSLALVTPSSRAIVSRMEH